MGLLGMPVLLLAGSIVGGCGLMHTPEPTLAPTSPPTLAVRIDTPDGPAGVARVNNSLQLLLFEDGAWHEVTFDRDRPGQTTIYLFTYGGETARMTNSFVFGNAPTGAAMIRISPEAAEGRVADGIYLVAVPSKALTPSELHWDFLRADGTAISSGSGIQG